MNKNDNKIGYSTTTNRYKLYFKHLDYIKYTKDLYNEGLEKYYNLLLNHLDFLELSNQYCLRELEKLTIISRDGEIPDDYIDLELPTYFRRAIINQAIGLVKTYVSLKKNYEKDSKRNQNPNKAIQFNCSPLFYKGMYKDLESNFISLKLWNGDSWNWYGMKFKGNLPVEEGIEYFSPTVVLNKKYAMIHIPIKRAVNDVRPVKERMNDENLRVCGINFSNSDSLAICVVLDRDGNFLKSKFIKGGKRYQNDTNKILEKIKLHRQNSKVLKEADHRTYWMKLNNLKKNMSHKVSKEIIDFCIENDVKVISIAKVDDNKDFERKVGKYSPIYLKKSIVNDLQYKAFNSGILITTVRSNYTASKCYKCRANIKRVGDKAICENGHEGDYFFNTAMNLSKMCLKKFGLIL